MSIDRYNVGHATLFVAMIALGSGLTAQSAPQNTQQPPASIGGVSSPDQGQVVDAVTGKASTGAKPPAPTPGASLPAPLASSGKVGPGGKAVGQGPSSPDGAVKARNAANERLGPGGAANQASNQAGFGPGGEASQPAPGQLRSSEVVTPKAGSQPEAKGPTARGGAFVFIDPATGLITEPTEAQLRDAEAQNATANMAIGEAVERPAVVGEGMIADVPAALFPAISATVDAEGKVTFIERERNGQAASSAVISQGPQGEQLLVSGDQRGGPAGDAHVELPPPTADAVVSIVNLDAAGEGFNDPTAVAPVFGNRGVTRGQQRLNAFRAAAEYWAGILRSTVPIQVSARMDPQFCNAGSAVLGSAGPNTVHRDFGGAPLAATWYVQAVANSRTGVDMDPGNTDISATFNSDVDNPVCLGATSWWYGIGAPAPAGTIDFFTVVLHEIGHGIGFLNLVNLGTGAKFGGFDDAYERWLWDWTVGGWPAMTNAQRVASAVNTGQVIFWGPRATEASRGLQTSGNNAGYPRVYVPNPVQGGSSISHFDTVFTPNELMEPAITAPPGPYAFVTSGLLQDIGWRLLANGVFDYNGLGTWTWNPTDGWFQPTGANPTNLEPFNGNFVGVYNGTWLWNETTSAWSQLTGANPTLMKACRDNLLWSSAAFGTWRWNPSTGWQQLTGANPQSLECLGGDMVWESPLGTWLYAFTGGGWSQITAADPVGVQPCGSHLAWYRGGDTWYWDAATGWHFLAGVGPETTECYRGQLAWEGAAGPGTWLYNFTTGTWQQITGANPEQMLAWGPSLVWENAAFGTWVYDGGWTQITSANPTLIEVLGADLLWSWPGGTWVWSGGGGGAGWTNITGAVPSEIVSTGAVR
jgi:hypothetical protein